MSAVPFLALHQTAEPPDIPGGRNLRRAPPSGLSGSVGDAVRARVRADAHAKKGLGANRTGNFAVRTTENLFGIGND